MAGIAQDVLRGSIVGIYLHGSGVLGGLHRTSDLDILVVTDRSTTEAERRALVQRLLDVSGRRARSGPTRAVELNVVVTSEMRPWRHPPWIEFLYGEWERDQYEAGFVPAPRIHVDFAPLIVTARDRGVAISGPPPGDVLAPVPASDLARSIVEGLPFLLGELVTDTRNVVLALARGWFTLATGEIASKDVAAAWAADRLPEHRALLDAARDGYLEGRDEDWADRLPAARALADALVEQIRRAALGP